MRSNGRRRVLLTLRLLIGLVAAGLAVWLGLVAFIVIKEKNVPQADPRDTQAIIALGAQVKADGTLSVQLQWRLDKTLEMYGIHPQPIVVCGARGTDEPVTEAQAMYDYLLKNGVREDHLLKEESSFNTRQNLENAKKLLGDTEKVMIVTSDYHLPRALALAEDIGFDATGVGSPIKPEYWIKNHFREALAWVKYIAQKCGVLS